MTTRMFAIAALGTLALSGCSYPAPEEPAKPDAANQAPAPREKVEKSKTELLLIGKWKLVKYSDRGLHPAYKRTLDFAPEGMLTRWVDNPAVRPDEPRGNPRTERGSYRVEGETLVLAMPGGVAPEVRLTIRLITEDKLVTSYPGSEPDDLNDPDYPMVAEYERVHQKL